VSNSPPARPTIALSSFLGKEKEQAKDKDATDSDRVVQDDENAKAQAKSTNTPRPRRPKQEPSLNNLNNAASWFSSGSTSSSKAEPDTTADAPSQGSSKSSTVVSYNVQDLPTLSSWYRNADDSITGVIGNSRDFDTGTEIWTAPVVETTTKRLPFGRKASIVTTVSGSRYRLVGPEASAEDPRVKNLSLGNGESTFKGGSPLINAPWSEYGNENENEDEEQFEKRSSSMGGLSFSSFFGGLGKTEPDEATVMEEPKQSRSSTSMGLSFSSFLGKPKVDPPSKEENEKDESRPSTPLTFSTFFGSSSGSGSSSGKSSSGTRNVVADSPQVKDKVKDKKRPGEFSLFGTNNPKNNGPGVAVLSEWEQEDDGSITGRVSNREGFTDGTWITTSPVKGRAKAGRIVTTSGGSRYRLL